MLKLNDLRFFVIFLFLMPVFVVWANFQTKIDVHVSINLVYFTYWSFLCGLHFHCQNGTDGRVVRKFQSASFLLKKMSN